MAVFAVALAASWIYWYGVPVEWTALVATLVFAVLLLLISAFPLKVTERGEIDTTDVVLVAALVLLGPVWAAIAHLPCALFVGRSDWLRGYYEASRTTVELFLAGMVFSAVSEPLLFSPTPDAIAPVVFATIAASVTLLVVNGVGDALLLRIKYDQGFKETWKHTFEPYLLSVVVNILTAGLGVLALLSYGPVAAVVAIAGSVVSQVIVYRSRDRVAENLELKERISALEESLKVSNLAFGTMMIEDIGRRDGYTHLHAAATSVYAADIAVELDMEEKAERLRMAGLLHNIGLFEVPEELLTASGQLNSIAKGKLSEHPAQGEAALASVPEFEEMATWVRWHHERPDGRGYPDRLRGPWIPLEARILAVAQAYAAMVLDQPRRPGLGFASAREELNSGIGTQFDEVVARAFLRILDTASEGYRMADDHRFAFPTTRRRDTPRPVRRDAENEAPDEV